jgi:nucleoside-diphosphate-sugar epimerase
MPDTFEFSRKPVLVLGASGFIGSRIVAALSAGPTYRPIAASRRSGLVLDATNPAAVRDALADMPFVINCVAGRPSTMVQSTQALCDAARAMPPRRIVHLSSMAVYGSATGLVREDRAPVAPISGYGQAKLECERTVRKYADDGGDAIILRPTCVFGPGSPQWTTRLVRLLRAGRIGDLGAAGDGGCNLAFVDDLVSATIAALDTPGMSGEAFNISSVCDLTWNEFLIALGKAIGAVPIRRISARRLRVETRVLAPILRIVGRAVRGSATEAITPSLAALWRHDIRVDCTAARSALDLRQTPVQDIIAAVVRDAKTAKEPAHS